MRTASMTSGMEPSGNVAVASPVSTSSRRLASAVRDVLGELVVQPRERGVLDLVGRVARAASSRAAVAGGASPVLGLGHPQQVGDDEHRERSGELR